MPKSVAIIFDSDFSGKLEQLAFRSPVWIVDTPANRTATEAMHHAVLEWPHISVTLFRPPDATKEDWRTLFEQIAIRDGSLDVIDVIGAPLTVIAKAALAESGMARVEETETGFRAKRA